MVEHSVWTSRRWGDVATAWATLFAVLHLYWALGGAWGLAESAGPRLAADRPGWFVALGLYGVAGLLLVAAGAGLILSRGVLVGRRGRALPLLGAGIAAVLTFRAIGVHVLLLADAGYGRGAISGAQRSWTLVVWNPWFFLGGVAFGLAAWAARRSTGSSTTSGT